MTLLQHDFMSGTTERTIEMTDSELQNTGDAQRAARALLEPWLRPMSLGLFCQLQHGRRLETPRRADRSTK